MIQKVRVDHSFERERILGDSVRSVAADLRMIDLPDIVTFLKSGQIGCVSALVQASIELSFKPETLKFGYSGDVYLDWGDEPRVSFDMEFHHQAIHVYFRLMLEAEEAGVEITYISFDGESLAPDQNTTRLHEALGEARLN